jgi:hypothetical protein
MIASWREPPTDLRNDFYEILHGFKQSYGTQWPTYYGSFPAPLKKKLEALYGL